MKVGDSVMCDIGPAKIVMIVDEEALIRLEPFTPVTASSRKEEPFVPAQPWRVRPLTALKGTK